MNIKRKKYAYIFVTKGKGQGVLPRLSAITTEKLRTYHCCGRKSARPWEVVGLVQDFGQSSHPRPKPNFLRWKSPGWLVPEPEHCVPSYGGVLKGRHHVGSNLHSWAYVTRWFPDDHDS